MIVDKIEADWLQWDAVTKVVEALGADHVRFVGGAVRDTLVDRPVFDIDAATTHKPEQTMTLLARAGIKAIPTGLQHGTVTAVWDGRPLEVTTLRVDVETDGRHAEVSFTEDWLEDAKRRDFTFNAMYVSADGSLFDPFNGRQDLIEGRVRFIGDAKERINEDGLRILRLFRFYAHFGREPLATEALMACAQLAPMLQSLSVERIRTELAKLLKADKPEAAIQAMEETGLFAVLGASRIELSLMERYLQHERQFGADIDPLMRLYRLFSPGIDAAALTAWLKLSNKNKRFLLAIETALAAGVPTDKKSMRRCIYQTGSDVALAIAVWAGNKQFCDYAREWQAPAFPVQGRDIMAEGHLAGPKIGETLKWLETEWIAKDFKLSREQLLDLL